MHDRNRPHPSLDFGSVVSVIRNVRLFVVYRSGQGHSGAAANNAQKADFSPSVTMRVADAI